MQISHFLLGYDIFPLKSDHGIGETLLAYLFFPVQLQQRNIDGTLKASEINLVHESIYFRC